LLLLKLFRPVSVSWVGWWSSHPIAIAQGRLAHQGKEGLQSGSVDFGGLELDSGGKQCCLIKALKASSLALSFASLALSRLSCSVSFSICFVLSSICLICFLIRSLFCLSCKIAVSVSLVRCSISRTGRQLRVDKNDRHRGSDAGNSPLLLDWEVAADEGDVVIGLKQGDQAEDQAADSLGKAKPVKTETVAAGPGALQLW